jgi:hypothetical protein
MPLFLKPIGTPMTAAIETALLADYLRVDSNDETTLLGNLALAATQAIAKYAKISLTEQQYQLTDDSWQEFNQKYPYPSTSNVFLHPSCARQGLKLPRPPVLSIQSVQVLSTNNTFQTVDTGYYTFVSDNGAALLLSEMGKVLPEPATLAGGIRLEYTAGYGNAAAVPASLRQAVTMLAAYWYEERGGQVGVRMPAAVQAMLEEYMRVGLV